MINTSTLFWISLSWLMPKEYKNYKRIKCHIHPKWHIIHHSIKQCFAIMRFWYVSHTPMSEPDELACLHILLANRRLGPWLAGWFMHTHIWIYKYIQNLYLENTYHIIYIYHSISSNWFWKPSPTNNHLFSADEINQWHRVSALSIPTLKSPYPSVAKLLPRPSALGLTVHSNNMFSLVCCKNCS